MFRFQEREAQKLTPDTRNLVPEDLVPGIWDFEMLIADMRYGIWDVGGGICFLRGK